jgi:hypothetical protein
MSPSSSISISPEPSLPLHLVFHAKTNEAYLGRVPSHSNTNSGVISRNCATAERSAGIGGQVFEGFLRKETTLNTEIKCATNVKRFGQMSSRASIAPSGALFDEELRPNMANSPPPPLK